MKAQKNIKIPLIIIGGGLSGLFAASTLIDHSESFFLIESSEMSIGGLASLGGMKIGLLPAGSKTADYLGLSTYENYTNAFLRNYRILLSEIIEEPHPQKTDYFLNKKYQSYVIEHNNVKLLLMRLINKIKERIIFDSVYKISLTEDNKYKIRLKNGTVLYCKKIIVACGRSLESTNILKTLGQKFCQANNAMVGCRATFKPTDKALKLYKHQVDFKIKAATGFQTYCFNYKGLLHVLRYGGEKYFSGTLNLKSHIGNTFIGKKTKIIDSDLSDMFKFSAKMDYNQILNSTFTNLGVDFKQQFVEFVDQFNLTYGIKFENFFFPAFEQFWPVPELKSNSLESKNTKHLYFIGDSSGICFGVLQCFILANYLIDTLVGKREIY